MQFKIWWKQLVKLTFAATYRGRFIRLSIVSALFPAMVACTCLIYYLLPHRFRWGWLLAVSYIFYLTFDFRYAVFLLASTFSTYISGILISKSTTMGKKKIWVALTCVLNFGILIVFKYLKFLGSAYVVLASAVGVKASAQTFTLLLPIGISFYTFQAITYTIDVYRGDVKPERHFGKYALFVSFFPTLVSGPIQKAKEMLPKFDEVHAFDYEKARRGGLLVLYGYFQKMAVADRLGVIVDTVFGHPAQYHGAVSVLASLFYTLQIYFDFAGYSNIAIGISEILGFDLKANFNHPYFSETVQEFWRRWHISLSTWFRDYLYIPLGGNRCSVPRQALNLMVVSGVCGLWHGPSLAFLAWGLLHGSYQVIGKFTRRFRNGLWKKLGVNPASGQLHVPRVAVTFLLVSFAWIFFRMNSLRNALVFIQGMLRFDLSALWNGSIFNLGLSAEEFCAVCIGILVIWAVDVLSRKMDLRDWILRRGTAVRWSFYIATVLVLLTFGIYGEATSTQQFIYAKF